MTLISPVRPGCHRPPMTGTADLPHLEHLTPAQQRRRLRAGGSGEPVFTSQPNGRPFRPYVYRGAGPFAADEAAAEHAERLEEAS